MKYVVEMLIDGLPVRKISYCGKTYLPVEMGKTFELKITNNSPKKISAVVSVDGLSVLSGSSARSDGPGYIIDAWNNVTIDGWRKSLSKVASFIIGHSNQSYASKMGKPSNVGGIGVAIYAEKKRRWPVVPIKLDEQAVITEKIHGCLKSDSLVEETVFTKDLSSKVVVVLHYNTVEKLREQGVPVDTNSINPFPGEPQRFFCPSPPE